MTKVRFETLHDSGSSPSTVSGRTVKEPASAHDEIVEPHFDIIDYIKVEDVCKHLGGR